MHFLYWSILLVPMLQILGIVFVWRKRQRIKVWGVVLTVILNLTVAFFLLNYAQSQMPLRSLLVFNPELGYASIVVATLGIGWSVVYTAMNLMMRKAK